MKRVEPYLVAILASHFRQITTEASNALFRSARSGVLNMAKDFSCAITDAEAHLVVAVEGLPVHLGNIQYAPEMVLELFGDDIRPGDCFINNCPYYGNVHHADVTLVAPVFYKGKLEFFSCTRAHYADIVRALRQDGYEGTISLESVYAPANGTREDGFRVSLPVFKDILS